MDRLLRDLRPSILDLHESCLRSAETKVLENEGLRLYGLVESEMSWALAALLKERLNDLNSTDPSVGWTASRVILDSKPLMADMEGAVPETGPSGGNITESVEGGGSSYAPKPESLGVNTSISIEITALSTGGGLILRDHIEVETGRLSPVDLLRSRGDRFADALRTGELSRIVSYTLETIAQTKALLGHGRDGSIPSGEVPGPVLTHEEVAACVDLSVCALARGHLGCTDWELLNRTEGLFSKAPGAGGEVPDLYSLISLSDSPMDPSLVALLSEGLFSSSNPPSLERMLRPFLTAALETLVFRILNYTGREDGMLEIVGGLSALMDLAVEGLNSATRTLFGTELITSSEAALDSMITGLLEEGGLSIPEGGFLMSPFFSGGVTWEEQHLDGFPELVLPAFSREVQVYLSTLGDEDLIYLSANGTQHSKADYFDPDDMFLGYRCDKYTVRIDYTINGLRPAFVPIDILADNDTRLELMGLLGSTSSKGDGVTEDELIGLGRRAVEEAIGSLLSYLSENGGGLWQDVWTGWSLDDLPPLCSEEQTFSLAALLSMDAVGSLVDTLSDEVMDSIIYLDISGERGAYRSTLGRWLADWLLQEYDRLVDREGQEDGAFSAALPLVLSQGSVISRSSYLDSKDIIYWHRDQITVCPSKDISVVLDDDQKLLELGMTIGDDGPGYGPLLEAVEQAVSESFDTIKSRELGTGSDGRDPGVVRAALTGTLNRSGSRGPSILPFTRNMLEEWIGELLNGTIRELEERFLGGLSIFGSRVLAPAGANSSIAVPRHNGPSKDGISLETRIIRDNDWTASVEAEDGLRSTDPEEEAPAYRTGYSVLFTANYMLSLWEKGRSGHFLELSLPVDIGLSLEVSSPWEMEGGAYTGTGTLLDKVTDVAGEAVGQALDVLLNGSTDLLGGTLGSLNEVPPIIRDILSGKDLDMAEMARVLSNVTLDLSRSLREALKDVLSELMELGIEGTITLALDLLGIDELELGLDIAGARIELLSYRKALMGENGTLLGVMFSVPSIGLKGAFQITREGDYVLFFGNVTYDKGPLYVRVLLDPYMLTLPHMVSIEGVLKATRDIRFSFACPALNEYRSLEISLKGSLGVEIMVPIPILGIQAVIDAGLRIRYMRPDEIAPHLNEARFDGENLTSVEIFDPRLLPVHGCTVELQDGGGRTVCSWEVRGGPTIFKEVRLTRENLLRCPGPLPSSGALRVLLRSPSGELLDDIETEDVRSGSISRDRDGYGVLRWTEGTPGASNGGSIPLGLSSLIFSIAMDSLKEAYDEATSLYPVSFEMVVHLVERAIDLFVERLVSVIRELVMDVRLFIHIEIEDASGSGGFGLELSFIALGDAVADLMEWLYLNIKAFMMDLMSGAGSGSFVAFPIDILEDCFVELLVFSQVETPVPLSKMAPPGVEIPDSLTMGIVGGFNMALPLRLLGMEVGSWSVYGGVYIMECPSSIVSLFYDLASVGTISDLWLLRMSIREGD
ncbi:MAG: hypothetical protein MUC62_01380 [Candidatus Thermoplasmatota archaeon]|nr:hypothetical protein [Candidatus Thermoplasmatota archaeon]